MTDRIDRLEAHVNALAQGWLRLAAALEVGGVVAPGQIEQSLRTARWPEQPFELEALTTVEWLCDQLADAQEVRQSLETHN
ncbi:hypothetical protein [Pseudomonas lactis]|uniref:hypothetical protein n=1 Tax=Pseudomonas lactis TaxID=1615674 RepID=UPI00147604AB|nr:hypothetical protein [Pseudomonas lactis]NNA49735.1 hypothetical protein [Pseudomonas lactis]